VHSRAKGVWLGIALLLLLTWLGGCDSGSEVRRVDFSRTRQVLRPGSGNPGGKTFRIAVGAMISPQPTLIHYQRIVQYLGKRLGRPVEMVQKKTYAELSAMLDQGMVEVAFICSGPYAKTAGPLGLRLLAAPRIAGSTRYQSYLIVNKDSPFSSLADLRGRSFAFTDPDSNSGHLVPRFWLFQMGEKPESFFAKLVYTHGHDNSIMAVARGLVDAAAVDSLVWKYHLKAGSALALRTKVIRESGYFGMPPVVASRHLADAEAGKVKEILLSMHRDPQGRRLLAGLHVERFVPARDRWYQPVRDMLAALEGR